MGTCAKTFLANIKSTSPIILLYFSKESVEKKSAKVVILFLFAISAILLAGSIPNTLDPKSLNGLRNVPSFEAISKTVLGVFFKIFSAYLQNF